MPIVVNIRFKYRSRNVEHRNLQNIIMFTYEGKVRDLSPTKKMLSMYETLHS